VVIHDLDVFSTAVSPSKAQAILIVDPDAVLACTVTAKGFKAIARRDAQVLQMCRNFQLPQLSQRHALELYEPSNTSPGCQPSGITALERPDHGGIVT